VKLTRVVPFAAPGIYKNPEGRVKFNALRATPLG